jgi:t-SNARE complex subunit (syntaxin)
MINQIETPAQANLLSVVISVKFARAIEIRGKKAMAIIILFIFIVTIMPFFLKNH